MEIKDKLKGMFGVTIGAVLAGSAMKTIGGVSQLPSGIRSATQAGIALVPVGMAANLFHHK